MGLISSGVCGCGGGTTDQVEHDPGSDGAVFGSSSVLSFSLGVWGSRVIFAWRGWEVGVEGVSRVNDAPLMHHPILHAVTDCRHM